jgi:signal transduction histidine kinase/class 3 adenylate cyclase
MPFALALAFASVFALAGRAAFASGLATAHVVVDDTFGELRLGRSLELAYDATDARSFEEVRGGAVAFTRSEKDVPSFGFRPGAEWARFRIDDRRVRDRAPLMLEYGYPSTDEIDVHAIDEAGVVTSFRAGDHVPASAWPVAGRFPSFKLPSGTREVYVAVRGTASHQIPLELSTADRWHTRTVRDAIVQAAYFGALGAMTVYNLIVWLGTGLAIYRTYVAFLASFAVFSLGYGGSLYAGPLGNASWLNDHLLVPAIVTYANSGVAFVFAMLDLGAFRERLAPFARSWQRLLAFVAIASLAIPYAVAMKTTLPLAAVQLGVCVVAGVVALRRGERVARWYMLAWSAFLLGSVTNIFRTFGIAPSNAFTENAQQAGSVVEFLLLSFALADRVKQLQHEATRNAELAAANARLAAESALEAQEASERALAEQERTNAELRRLDQVKDEFLANTSHELRTPIHGVTGILDALMGRPSLTAADREDITHALASAQRLSSLVSSVLDFSQFRSGQLTVERAPVDFARILEDECARLRPEAQVPLRVGSLERTIAAHGDASRLRQLAAQLLSNAVKFTPSGAIDVALRADGEDLVLEIRDTGVGIAAERLEGLFAGLEQGDGSTTREAGGLGIGLALAKRIAEAHGGELALRSTVGEGTTVVARIPGTREIVASVSVAPVPSARIVDVRSGGVAEAELRRMTSMIPQRPDLPRASALPSALPSKVLVSNAPASMVSALRAPGLPAGARGLRGLGAPAGRRGVGAGEDPAPSSDSPSSGAVLIEAQASDAGVRILVADDDPMNRRVIRLQLAPLGFELIEAEDGADAMAKVESSGPFDAVLLDVMMPKASGYDVCRKIRETKSATELPVLMLTAKAQVRDLLEGFEAGANDYVPKPFSKAELLARIRTHVTVARTHQSLRRFVPQGALEILGHENVVDVRLGDTTERELAVLFSDVRGFTGLSQKRSPAEIFALLNQCYARIGPVVRSAGGFVDKYIGDGLMALFPNGAEAAVRAAVAMQRALTEPIEGEELRIGVGIHVGPTMLGTLGEPDRFDATVISDAVNLASRVEGASKQLGAKLLVSRATFESLPEGAAFEARGLGRVQVKGREGFVEVVEILDAEEPELAREKAASREAFASAVERFIAGDWSAACAGFGAIVDTNITDAAAMLYLAAATLAEAGDLSNVGPGSSLVLHDK